MYVTLSVDFPRLRSSWQNLTCPHCRTEINSDTPFIPNIAVDQIIERKLRNLGEGAQQVSLMTERTDKSR